MTAGVLIFFGVLWREIVFQVEPWIPLPLRHRCPGCGDPSEPGGPCAICGFPRDSVMAQWVAPDRTPLWITILLVGAGLSVMLLGMFCTASVIETPGSSIPFIALVSLIGLGCVAAGGIWGWFVGVDYAEQATTDVAWRFDHEDTDEPRTVSASVVLSRQGEVVSQSGRSARPIELMALEWAPADGLRAEERAFAHLVATLHAAGFVTVEAQHVWEWEEDERRQRVVLRLIWGPETPDDEDPSILRWPLIEEALEAMPDLDTVFERWGPTGDEDAALWHVAADLLPVDAATVLHVQRTIQASLFGDPDQHGLAVDATRSHVPSGRDR